jgi:hypothetical protein
VGGPTTPSCSSGVPVGSTPAASAKKWSGVRLLARSASLASAAHPPRVLVGRSARASVRAGTLTFTAALDARARQALSRHRRLALLVQIQLTSPQGEKLTLSRSVLLLT